MYHFLYQIQKIEDAKTKNIHINSDFVCISVSTLSFFVCFLFIFTNTSVAKTIKSKQSHFKTTSPTQTDMQSWEEQSQGAIYTVEYACR